jgi:hypothetical protein
VFGSPTRASRPIVGGDSAQPRKPHRILDCPLQIFCRAPQESGPIPEIAEPEVARHAEQAADDVPHGTMIHAEPVAEFLSADRATAPLALEHGRILFKRDPILGLQPACEEHISIGRVFGVALAQPRADLAFRGSVVGTLRCKFLLPILRVLRVAFAPALGTGQRRGACAGALLAMAPLAPAMFARALAVTGHEMLRRPDARKRAWRRGRGTTTPPRKSAVADLRAQPADPG